MIFRKNQINYLELTATHFINELKAVFNDRGALLILVGAMLIYPIVYSIAYSNETLNDIPVAVVDLDHSELSRKYAAMLDATTEIKVTYKAEDLSAAQQLFMENKVSGIVLLPGNFEKNILSGSQTTVAVYADAGYFLKYKNILLAASYSNAYFSGAIAIQKYLAEGKSMQKAKIENDPLPVQTHILYNPAGGYASFIMPGMILIIIQQTLLIGIGVLGGSFSESKASPFLLATDKRKHELLPYLAGKSSAYLFITLFNFLFAVVLLHQWFNFPDKASVSELLILLFPYFLSTIFLGIGLSSLFKHRESAIVFMVFLSPIALFVSGLSWPASAMPDALVWASNILPSTTAVPAYLRLRTMGVGISGVKSELIQLYIQAGTYLVLTLVYFYFYILFDERKRITTAANK